MAKQEMLLIWSMDSNPSELQHCNIVKERTGWKAKPFAKSPSKTKSFGFLPFFDLSSASSLKSLYFPLCLSALISPTLISPN